MVPSVPLRGALGVPLGKEPWPWRGWELGLTVGRVRPRLGRAGKFLDRGVQPAHVSLLPHESSFPIAREEVAASQDNFPTRPHFL